MTTAPVTTVNDDLIAYYIEYHDSDAECGVPCSITEYEMALELKQLRAERAELKRDAERYRWLCDGHGYFMEEEGLCGHYNEKQAADEAIDAAMQQP